MNCWYKSGLLVPFNHLLHVLPCPATLLGDTETTRRDCNGPILYIVSLFFISLLEIQYHYHQHKDTQLSSTLNFTPYITWWTSDCSCELTTIVNVTCTFIRHHIYR